MIDENLFVSKQFFMHLLFVSTKTVGFTEIKPNYRRCEIPQWDYIVSKN